MAALIPDEKRLVLLDKKYLLVAQNAAGYHPGQVLPSRADGAPLKGLAAQNNNYFI